MSYEASTHDRPRYYITNVELEFDPIIGQTILGNISMSIDMYSPEFDKDSSLFTCWCDLGIELDVTGVREEGDEIEEETLGEIDLEMIIALEGRDGELASVDIDDEIETWSEDGYSAISKNLRYIIESEILNEILFPLSSLLSDQYRGLTPRIALQSSEQREEDNEEETNNEEE